MVPPVRPCEVALLTSALSGLDVIWAVGNFMKTVFSYIKRFDIMPGFALYVDCMLVVVALSTYFFGGKFVLASLPLVQ